MKRPRYEHIATSAVVEYIFVVAGAALLLFWLMS